MRCATHIVECLRVTGTEPEAYASSENFSPFNALIYNKEKYFQSAAQSKPQWWSINFKTPVSINGYEIVDNIANSGSSCIYNWTISVSRNNKTWTVIHGPVQNDNTIKSYNFSQTYNAIYARIDGNSKYSNDPSLISFYYIKFFGSFINVKNVFSCRVRQMMNTNLMRIILIIYS